MKVILFFMNLQQISEKRDFHNVLWTLFFLHIDVSEKFGLNGFMRNYIKKLCKKVLLTLAVTYVGSSFLSFFSAVNALLNNIL
jgi:hypothetical protein